VSYWLEDADGKWLGDFATNKGIIEMREKAGSALLEFLDEGEADAELVEKVIDEVKGDSELSYVAKLLKKGDPPVIITDGCGYV